MKIKLLPFGIAILSCYQNSYLQAQTANCAPASSQFDFSVNKVRTILQGSGDVFFNRDGGVGSLNYEVPKGSGKSAIFVSALWIAGFRDNNLKSAGQIFGSGRNDDYWPGPLTDAGSTTTQQCAQYDKHYFVTKTEIDAFVKNGTPAASITNWPGNRANNQPLAPYVDTDNNGIYQPAKGDYPKITGNGMAWWVFNDVGNTHNKFFGKPIGLEVQQSCFGFDVPYIGLDHTLFERYKLVYRGSATLDSTFTGIYTHFDLGYYNDDYIGCEPSLNMYYCYNGDDHDEGKTGYGAVTPAIGIQILEGVEDTTRSNVRLSKFMYFNYEVNEQFEPENDIQLYRTLNGRWRDGSKLSYGGTGYNLSSADFSDFAFPGTKDPKGRAEWSEKTAGNKVGDKGGVGIMGPIELVPGAVCDFTIGIPFVQGGTSEESLTKLLELGAAQQAFFDSNFDLSNVKTVAYWQKSSEFGFEGKKKQLVVVLNATPSEDITLKIVPDTTKGTKVGDAIFTPSTITFKKGEALTKTIDIEAVAGKLSNKPYRVLHYKLELVNTPQNVTINWCNLAFGVYALAKPINTINGTDATGSPIKLNEFVAVKGLVYGEFIRQNTNISIADGTGGIAVDLQNKVRPNDFLTTDFANTNSFTELWVYGKIIEQNGVTTMVSEDFIVLPTKNRKTPLSVLEVKEVHESDLIVFKNCSVVDDAEWKSSSNLTNPSFSTRFTNGKDTILVKYQELTSGITPPKNVDVYGVGYQYDQTTPYTSNRMLRVPHKSYIVPAGTLNISNTLSLSNIRVYPNPATDQLTITSDAGDLKTIRIYSITGTKVFEQTQMATQSITVNTAEYLQTGIYIIELTDAIGATAHKKIVVN